MAHSLSSSTWRAIRRSGFEADQYGTQLHSSRPIEYVTYAFSIFDRVLMLIRMLDKTPWQSLDSRWKRGDPMVFLCLVALLIHFAFFNCLLGKPRRATLYKAWGLYKHEFKTMQTSSALYCTLFLATWPKISVGKYATMICSASFDNSLG